MASAPSDELHIPLGKGNILVRFASWLVIPPVVVGLLSSWTTVSPHTTGGFLVFGFFAVMWAGLLACLAWLFVAKQPGLVLDSKGIRSTMPLRGADPGCIAWTELVGARPVWRYGNGLLSGGRGSFKTRFVDLEFRDPEKFLDRLGPDQVRYRTPYYRKYGIPYSVCVEYCAQTPEEIAETIRRYIAKYGGPAMATMNPR